jgi:hypothetical protein
VKQLEIMRQVAEKIVNDPTKAKDFEKAREMATDILSINGDPKYNKNHPSIFVMALFLAAVAAVDALVILIKKKKKGL